MVRPSASPNVLQAMEMLEQYGDMCDVMYLMMAADGRVLNVEREVMRGALDILSDGRIRTVHMEAMIDLCSRRVAEHGAEKSLQRAIKMLRDDPVRAETAVVLAAAVAAADAAITPEEHELLSKLAAGFAMGEARAQKLLEELVAEC